MAGKIITKQEALQYNADSLLADTHKRENNINIFKETINKEYEAISLDEHMISSIDPDHPDVIALKNLIAKKKINIKTFEDAIKEEEIQIERDLEMIKLINKNNKSIN